MTLPTSGPITLYMVAAELGIGLPLSLGDSRVRTLAGVPSGPITLGQLRGKSASSSGGGDGGTSGPAFAAYGTNAAGSSISTNAGGTVSCSPSVTESGGTAPYTRTWSFTSNPGGCTLANANSTSCTVSKTFTKLSDGSASAVLQCVSTDSAGASVTTSNINANLDWSSNR